MPLAAHKTQQRSNIQRNKISNTTNLTLFVQEPAAQDALQLERGARGGGRAGRRRAAATQNDRAAQASGSTKLASPASANAQPWHQLGPPGAPHSHPQLSGAAPNAATLNITGLSCLPGLQAFLTADGRIILADPASGSAAEVTGLAAVPEADLVPLQAAAAAAAAMPAPPPTLPAGPSEPAAVRSLEPSAPQPAPAPAPEPAAARGDASERRSKRAPKHPAGLAGALAGLLALKSGDVPPALKDELEAAENVSRVASEPPKRAGRAAADASDAGAQFSVPAPKLQRRRSSCVDVGDAAARPSVPKRPKSAAAAMHASIMPSLALGVTDGALPGAALAHSLPSTASIVASGSLSGLSELAHVTLPLGAAPALPISLPAAAVPGAAGSPFQAPGAPGNMSAGDLALLGGLMGPGAPDVSGVMLQHLQQLASFGLHAGAALAPEQLQSLAMTLAPGAAAGLPPPQLPPAGMAAPVPPTLPVALPAACPALPKASGAMVPPPSKAALSTQGSLSGTGMGSVETSTFDGAASHEVASQLGNGSECCSDMNQEHNVLAAMSVPMRPHSTPPGFLYMHGVGSNLKSSMGSLLNLNLPLMAGLQGLSTSKSSSQLRPSMLKQDDADDRTLQRRARNRDAARRTRLKKMLLLQGGEARVNTLADTLESKTALLADILKRVAQAEALNVELKAKLAAQAAATGAVAAT